jgi:RNA polymerase sigma-70 factor, ECF subfamily
MRKPSRAHWPIIYFRGYREEQIVGWLTRILIRRASVMKRQFRGTDKRDIKREKPIHNQFTHDPGPVREDKTALQEKDEVELMRRTFHLLPPDYQEIVRLHYQEGMTFLEAAEEMNRSVEAVKKLWVRALRYWRKEMERLQGV